MNSLWFKSSWQIVLLVVLQVILSLIYIDAHSIDLDEPFSIFYSQYELAELWKLFESENNPPLHFLLLHGWIKLFGTEPIAVRSLSLLFGIASTVVLYKTGKRISGPRTGVISSLFFIFSNFHFYHNLEARSYPILVFLVACILLLLVDFYQNFSKLSYAYLSFICVALFYTHYIAPVILFTIGSFLVIRTVLIQDKKNRIQHLKGLFFITLPLFLLLSFPLLNLFLRRISHVSKGGTWVSEAQWTELYGQLNKFMNGREVVFTLLIWLVILLLSRKGAIMSYLKRLYSHSSLKFLLIFFLAIFLLTFSLSKLSNFHLFLDRYIYFLTLPIFLLTADFIAYIQKKHKWLGIVPVIAFIAFFSPNIGNNRESDKIAAYFQARKGTILISPPTFDLTFIYHYDKSLFEKKLNGKQLFQYGIYPIYTLSELKNIDKLPLPIYYLDADSYFVFKHHNLKEELASSFDLIDSVSFKGNYTVYTFKARKN